MYANRRRIKGERGKALLRKRGELIERNFAHCYDTGGMRRVHLRGRENISKRLIVLASLFSSQSRAYALRTPMTSVPS